MRPDLSAKLPYALRHALSRLGPLIEDGSVTDIFVNGGDGVWVDRGSGTERANEITLSAEEARALAVSLIGAGGRHLDELNPCVDVRLAHGIRVHAVLPPVSTGGSLVSVRLPRTQHLSFAELVARGLCDQGTADRLTEAVRQRQNILITGPTGSGKTTLLAALLSLAEPSERILTVEDVAELHITHPHVVSLEARQANIEGAGGVPLERLVREALRMRPSRLVVGECRGAELPVLLGALNTGHNGGAGTVHASSLSDVPARLEALGASAGIEPQHLARQVLSAIHLVAHLTLDAGTRSISHLGRFVLDRDGLLSVAAET